MEYFDFGVNLAFLLTIISTLLCVYYGAVNWNKGSEDSTNKKAKQWAKLEDKIEEKL
jgi:hypothetical protein